MEVPVVLLGGEIERCLNAQARIQHVLGEVVTKGCICSSIKLLESTFMTTGPVAGRSDRFTLYGEHLGMDATISTKHGLRYIPPAELGAPDGYEAYPLNDESRLVVFTDPSEVAAIKQLRAAHDRMQKLFEDLNSNLPPIDGDEV